MGTTLVERARGRGGRGCARIKFLARRFPESRRKAYYLMSIHEHLPPQARKDLKEIGWTKGRELAKLARRDGQRFDCAPWVHKARSMPREDFRREVEKELTGREEELSELIYFKVYKSQIPVIEQAIETAALMLGTDKSRGYCLEMICADFLAGANLDEQNPETLLCSMTRFMKMIRPKAAPPRIDPLSYESLRQQILRRDGWRCQSCGSMSNLEVHHREFRSHSGSDSEKNLITLFEGS